MKAAFNPEQTKDYVYIDGSALKEGAWEGIKGAVGKGMGLAADTVKAIGSQLATPQAFAQVVTIGVNTLTPNAGGLNSNQQLSRFKENSKSADEPGGEWFRHYTSYEGLQGIKSDGFIKYSKFGTFGPGVYLTNPGNPDLDDIGAWSTETYIDVFLTNQEKEVMIETFNNISYIYRVKATKTPVNLSIRDKPHMFGPEKE